MKRKIIEFTNKGKVDLIEEETGEPAPEEVVVKTAFSTVSPGTERANLLDAPNCGGYKDHQYPRRLGYSAAGVVVQTGSAVKNVRPGDRVVAFNGIHASCQRLPEDQVVRIPDETVSLREASMAFIAAFSLAAIRKCRLEIGESALVMGCGLLGQFSVKLLRAAGAVPVIAADPVETRRREALENGADFAFSPDEADFAGKVIEKTGGGAAAVIEVTGVGAGLAGALDCVKRLGRVALLGCTRDPNFTIDYYHKVHMRGISLIGAHTNARPKTESRPGNFTQRDDIRVVLDLLSAGRIDFQGMLREEAYSPEECQSVYDRVANDRSFPTVAQFDWRQL